MVKLRYLLLVAACPVLPSASWAFQPTRAPGANAGLRIEDLRGNAPVAHADAKRRGGRGIVALCLSLPRVKVTFPTPDEAAEMGARDWPQQLKRDSWSEKVDGGKSVVRYVLDGAGTIESSSEESSIKSRVGPGSLVEVTGPTVLKWQIDDEGDMIILTPGFEEGGLLLGVFGAFVALCGALIAAS